MSEVPARTGDGGPIRILLADDHPVVRDGLAGMLRREADLDVVAQADGGHAAVSLTLRHDPDVVLMDLRMPAGDGLEAIRTLRAAHPGRPRILVLTTYDTARDVRAALHAGADGYLLKDVGREELVRAIRDLAAGRPVLTGQALAALTGRTSQTELTAREAEVLALVAEGRTNRAIAHRLGIGEATVKTHLAHVYEKLRVADRASAVRAAWERGLV